ncbi:AAA family ATPase [Leptotrichia massiliensis]|uniref:AAA family ATPase n=1 Tax=Leptotrichia massiliensis TaxID=1852388 RepID=UPI0008DB234A|nr:AAA family ATPase [Leptotrichia massiliensis]
MSFSDVFKSIKDFLLNQNGIEIKETDYDSLLVKQLSGSNILGEKGKQTHIAITGESMEMFPYIYSKEFIELNNKEMKNFFVLKAPMKIYQKNYNYFSDINNIDFNNKDFLEINVCIYPRNKGDQVQLSMLSHDSKEFIEYRKSIKTNDFLVVLKYSNKLQYDVFVIKNNDGMSFIDKHNLFKIKDNKKKTDMTFISKENFCFNDLENINLTKNINKPHQRIFFGAPGTGKSYLLNEDAKKYFGNNYERVTFHPNYMYGNFIGTFKPFPVKLENGKETIMYKYIPGVLLRLLIKAIKNPVTNYLLIIEEINRANTAAVFGDFFQLLDRNGNGESEYGIAVSEDLKLYLEEEFDKNNLTENEKRYLGEKLDKITLPPNFYIWATMNSADQGVMPLDTAFKRRWEFEYTGIDDAYNKSKDESGKSEFDDYKFRANGKELSNWNDFRIKINEILSKCHVSEDKLIGPYFISKSILASKDIDKITNAIKNKVLMYLYEDAGRQHRKRIFKEGKWETYSKLCEAFDENCEEIFNDKVELPDKTPIEVGEEIIRGTKEEEKIQENETEITENTESIDE